MLRAGLRPGPAGTDLVALVDRALERSGPGRGLPDLPLALDGPGRRNGRLGAPPIDPADVPSAELVRVAVGLLVDELLRGPAPAPVGTGRAGGPGPRRPWRRRRFRLAGAPTGVALARSDLAARGRAEGGRHPDVLVLAAPVESLLGQVWSGRVQHGAPVSWVGFTDRLARRDALPPRADPAAVAARWAGRVGTDRVHVVVGADPRAAVRSLLGVPDPAPAGAGRPGAAGPRPAPLTAAAVDVLRRTNQVLSVRVPAEQQDLLRARLTGLLPHAGPGHDAPGLTVPTRHRTWVEAQAARVVEQIRAGGYPVHGDLAEVGVHPTGRRRPHRPEVLDLVLDTVLEVARRADAARPTVQEGGVR